MSDSSVRPTHALEATMDSMTDTIVEHTESSGPHGRSINATVVESAPSSVPSSPRSFDETDQCDASLLTFIPPPANEHRCLILCFDGTGDQFDADNSNIVQLVSALKKDDRTKQMVYYQSGIGTYTSPKVATPFLTKISLTLDAMIAWNLDAHVMAGYEFLMQNYTANDRICIFGFSRGAYIARSLAGMLHKVGLLPVDNHQQVPFAYKMYTRADGVGWAQSNAFKKAFCNDVHIEFLGVWDTVNSVGLIPRRLPFTTSNTIVRTFRHAVSLDERRAKFKANLWNYPNDWEKTLGTHSRPETPTLPTLPKHRYTLPFPKFKTPFRTSSTPDDDMEQEKFETAYAHHHTKSHKTDVLEVWFAGCHCDVGGGSVGNDTRHSLARIPLRWMIRECFKAGTGMIFDTQRLKTLGLDPTTLYPAVVGRAPAPNVKNARIEPPPRASWLRKVFSRDRPPTPSPELEDPEASVEDQEDLQDALSPMYDQLKLKPLWWILEILPMSFRSQELDDRWVTKVRANLGRPRKIPHQSSPEDPDHPHHENKPPVTLYVHRSVQTRREARDSKGRIQYMNRAHFKYDPHWVD
ncbi:hypothetical protein FB451DRAFT_1393527 [Mycena latifolia]|nr:hypothetical protein FB451DRAFT_1393527 [Mycena latifolia]